MRGPIDFIVVGFEGNKFDGSIIESLSDAVEKETIRVLTLALIQKDNDGAVTMIDVADLGNEFIMNIASSTPRANDVVAQDDINEVSDLLENNTAAGLLIIEHLWAKPLKQAIIDAGGVLVAEGRIHPDAAAELNQE